jgi:hypothetical protein
MKSNYKFKILSIFKKYKVSLFRVHSPAFLLGFVNMAGFLPYVSDPASRLSMHVNKLLFLTTLLVYYVVTMRD